MGQDGCLWSREWEALMRQEGCLWSHQWEALMGRRVLPVVSPMGGPDRDKMIACGLTNRRP